MPISSDFGYQMAKISTSDHVEGSNNTSSLDADSRPTEGSSPNRHSDYTEESPPPLPPRPKPVAAKDNASRHSNPAKIGINHSSSSSGPLQAKPTTALSVPDAQKLPHGGDTTPHNRNPSSSGSGGDTNFPSSEVDESMSVRSLGVTPDIALEAESMLGDVLEKDALAWTNLGSNTSDNTELPQIFREELDLEDRFEHEFD